MERLAVLGATGYTGRLVVADAREAGLPLRLVGRDERKLARLGGEYCVADARDGDALAAAFDGASVVISLAGPFLEVGFAPVQAAVAAGVHYLDSTGEQAFARRVYEQFAGAPVVLLTAFGFDYVPGDLAARLAADGLGPLEQIAVGYSVASVAPSRGTLRTMATVAGRPHAAWVEGKLVESSFGATTRRFAFPFGEREAVEWGSTEPLTVPRHTDVRNVRAYLRAPQAAARAAPLARLGAPLLRAAARLGSDGPSEQKRRRSRWTIVAEADGRRVTVAGRDVYGFTARCLVRGALALMAGEVTATGALAPAEAFDARSFLERLAPFVEDVDVRSGA